MTTTLGWTVPPTIGVDLPGGGHRNGWAGLAVRVDDRCVYAATVNLPLGGILNPRQTLDSSARLIDHVHGVWDRFGHELDVERFVVAVEGVATSYREYVSPDRVEPMRIMLHELRREFGCRVVPPAPHASLHLARYGGGGWDAHYPPELSPPWPADWLNEHPERRTEHARAAWVVAGMAVKVPRPLPAVG